MTEGKIKEFEVTDSQQSVIDLIVTWQPKNVKLAIELDRSQELGVEEIYKTFLKEINIWGDLDEKYDLFPIESCFFEKCWKSEWERIPKKISSEEEVIFHIKKRVLLFGRNEHFVLEERGLSEYFDWVKIVDEINSYFKQDDFLIIEDLPF